MVPNVLGDPLLSIPNNMVFPTCPFRKYCCSYYFVTYITGPHTGADSERASYSAGRWISEAGVLRAQKL